MFFIDLLFFSLINYFVFERVMSYKTGVDKESRLRGDPFGHNVHGTGSNVGTDTGRHILGHNVHGTGSNEGTDTVRNSFEHKAGSTASQVGSSVDGSGACIARPKVHTESDDTSIGNIGAVDVHRRAHSFLYELEPFGDGSDR